MTNFLFWLFCHGGKDIQTGGWDGGFGQGGIFLKPLLQAFAKVKLQMASVMEVTASWLCYPNKDLGARLDGA